MAIRRRGPALIELVQGRDVARSAPPSSVSHLPPPRPAPFHRPPDAARPAPLPPPPPLAPAPIELAASASILPGAGSAVRVPVGYVYLALTGVIVLVIAGYSVGFSRGKTYENSRLASSQSPIPGPDDDPLNKPIANSALAPANKPAAPPQTKSPAGSTPAGGAQTKDAPKKPAVSPSGAAKPSDSGSGGGAGGDPRTAGLNYFVLADRITEEEAQAASDFLNAHGVAASVVFSNNAKFRRVIATRGFAGAEVSGPDATRLKADAARIGALYKSQERGPVDFAKPYPEKFQP